jgi:hypothetical protein
MWATSLPGWTIYPEEWSVSMRWFRILVCSAALAGSACFAQAQAAPAKAPAAKDVVPIVLPPVPKPLLPDAFAGWVAADKPKTLPDPAQADPANAAALKEYDFTDGALGNYKHEGETLSIRALRFEDLSGAYGAYTLYRQNGWPKEEIGAGAASNHNRVLFWKGNTVVDAQFSRIGPMSGSQLRELASQLPILFGSRAIAPPILVHLPKTSIDKQTSHYALGPTGYAAAGGVLPPDLVGFDRGAEAVTANYTLTSGPATLTIIDYPTPQMAAAQETRIRAYIKAGSQAQPAFPQPLKDSDQASLEVRRSGPLVIVVSGDAIPDESHKLLESVNYEADIMSVPQPTESEIAKTGQLLLGIAYLVIIGASAAILLGFFLGGFRAMYRLARGKPISSVYDEEFIHLDLRDDRALNAVTVTSPHQEG